jgi:hypothetical protein
MLCMIIILIKFINFNFNSILNFRFIRMAWSMRLMDFAKENKHFFGKYLKILSFKHELTNYSNNMC